MTLALPGTGDLSATRTERFSCGVAAHGWSSCVTKVPRWPAWIIPDACWTIAVRMSALMTSGRSSQAR